MEGPSLKAGPNVYAFPAAAYGCALNICWSALLFSCQFRASFWAHSVRRPVIRTVALTLICLAGLGAIAGAAIRSTPPLPEPVRPIVAGNKVDRLPLVANEKVPKGAEKIDTAYVQPADEVQSSPPAETPPLATPAPPDSRALKVDEAHSAKATKTHKIRQSANRSRRMVSADPSPKQVSAPPPDQPSVLKECSSSGLDPLLRKLNLSPPCN